MASKYCSMTLVELKGELRSRNAKLSGRKKELVERLEAYDRNQNFGQDSAVVSEYQMDLPHTSEYRDIHADKKLAPVTIDLAYEYLSLFNTEFDDAAKSLYREKHLIYLRLCSSESYDFVKSAVRAAMKTHVVYGVDISLKKTGCVEEAQCECGAGQGPHGHCKHVRAVLYGCCQFNKKGNVLVELTCTEKLQSFHKAKRFAGSPLKARDLNMPGADEVTNFSDHDTRPEKFRGMDSYPSFFYGTCMNFSGISKMPIFQLYPPANAFAVAHDHDYLLQTPEDMFLDVFGVSGISEKQRSDIEYLTRGQQKSEKWHAERSKRIQSSNFGRICLATEKTDHNKLANTLISPQFFSSDPVRHGMKYEKEALRVYEQDFQVKVDDCGIFVSRALPFLGASPDGVVDSNYICEVKCPFTAINKDISPVTVPYLTEEENKLRLKRNHQYFYQVQGQLFCSEREFCDFIVYTIKDIAYIRIQRDNDFISEMTEKLQAFYKNHFQQALLTKHFYKPL